MNNFDVSLCKRIPGFKSAKVEPARRNFVAVVPGVKGYWLSVVRTCGENVAQSKTNKQGERVVSSVVGFCGKDSGIQAAFVDAIDDLCRLASRDEDGAER